ncbi:MAG: hypothetical protein PHE58_07045, partial [Candidatus Omnitrophica bacterium]|nr:hypothetical protein [Candidatus Omnitrophota bacterium]
MIRHGISPVGHSFMHAPHLIHAFSSRFRVSVSFNSTIPVEDFIIGTMSVAWAIPIMGPPI